MTRGLNTVTLGAPVMAFPRRFPLRDLESRDSGLNPSRQRRPLAGRSCVGRGWYK